MSVILAITLFAFGLGLILYCAERLVRGVVGTSVGFGLSPFLINVVFIGFDPENLVVGAVGSLEGQAGIALGSIIGSAMVAIALAFGITALFTPMSFATVPKRILLVLVLSVLLSLPAKVFSDTVTGASQTDPLLPRALACAIPTGP